MKNRYFRVLTVLGGLLALLCLACQSTGAADEQTAIGQRAVQMKTYQMGTDYEIRAEQKTATPEIREFFSFWCGHCFMMSEPFEMVARHFRGQAAFVLNPVGLLGGEMGVESQRAYVVAQNHGLDQDFYQLLMKRIHLDNQIPESHEDYVKIFEELGLEEGKFNQEFNSFPVQGAQSEFDKLCDSYKIEAVPEIMVNGKYYVNMEKLDTVQDLIDIINFLLSQP